MTEGARVLMWGAGAGLLGGVAGCLLSVVPSRGAELWREGPVVIEAQDRGSALAGEDWAQPIMTVDRGGAVWREGKPLSALSREELVKTVRELASYEVQRSRPPEVTFRRRHP